LTRSAAVTLRGTDSNVSIALALTIDRHQLQMRGFNSRLRTKSTRFLLRTLYRKPDPAGIGS